MGELRPQVVQQDARSELIAVVKTAYRRVRLHVDAAAAFRILERRGVGRVRHLDIGVLWLQEQQLRRVVKLTKVLGTSIPQI